MLRYNNINILFILIVLVFSALIFTNDFPWWSLLIVLFIYLHILVLGSIIIRWNFYTHSLTQLKDKSSILLSFDDGPDELNTIKILNLLDKYQAKAVFFLIGVHIEKYPILVKEIQSRGHIIGNHSYSHYNKFPIFSVNKMLGEIEETNDLIERAIGEKPQYFRPPFGVTNPRINRLLKRSGMKSVAWSYRSFDGGNRPKTKIIQDIKRKIKGGEILLFHDNRVQTVEILEEVLPWLKERFNLNTNLENAI